MSYLNQKPLTITTKPSNNDRKRSMSLYNIKGSIQVILHFDLMERSKINIDWPYLMLIISDNQRYSLRPLFLAC